MTPGTYPLALYRGDTYHWQFLLWEDAGKTVPYDLTGVTVKSEIRDRFGGSQIVSLTCVVTLPNSVDVDLDAAASATLPLAGVWDLQLTYPSAEVATVLAGPVNVTADVTDSTLAARAEIRLAGAR
jgi:hypothetical protein